MTPEEAEFNATLVALADAVCGRRKSMAVDAIAYALAQILAIGSTPTEALRDAGRTHTAVCGNLARLAREKMLDEAAGGTVH